MALTEERQEEAAARRPRPALAQVLEGLGILLAAGTLGFDLQIELQRRCRDDRWSSARRDCLLRAADQEATLDCPLQ